MKKTLCICILFAALCSFAQNIVARTENGMLCQTQGKYILFVAGTPVQMGTAHGKLLAKMVPNVAVRTVALVGAAYSVDKGDWFYERMEDIISRAKPHTPQRFVDECLAMGKAAGISERDALNVNFFPELFHCSGVAVRGEATADGQVIHARVLDYLSDVNLHRYAVFQVFLPEGMNAWASVGFASFLGTVTAMNEKGLAMGEMGGGGEGNWDGMPMTFLMRDIMERAGTVAEALEILRSTKRTCEYYYVLSDKSRAMAGVYATPEKLEVLMPGEQHKLLPPVPKDTIMISAGNRAKHLSRRLHENHGKITAQLLTEIIRRPVAMNSNLHDAIFMPETLDYWFADAGRNSPACDQPYAKVNLGKLIEFYKSNITPKKAEK